jgi:hypothetical protein
VTDSPITARGKDFAAWYQDVVLQGDMVEPAEVVSVPANSIEEVESMVSDGRFVTADLKDDPETDARIKSFKASVRNTPLVDEYDGPGKCIITGESVTHRVVIAKSYQVCRVGCARKPVGQVPDLPSD